MRFILVFVLSFLAISCQNAKIPSPSPQSDFAILQSEPVSLPLAKISKQFANPEAQAGPGSAGNATSEAPNPGPAVENKAPGNHSASIQKKFCDWHVCEVRDYNREAEFPLQAFPQWSAKTSAWNNNTELGRLLNTEQNFSIHPEERAWKADIGVHFDLDRYHTQTMQDFFEYYTTRAKKTFAMWLRRSETYIPIVREVFVQKDLPLELIFLPFAESGYNPRAYSRAGAAGIWQFIPGTARHYGLQVDWWIDERRDPYLSTQAAAEYLGKLHDNFGDWYLALAAYNTGEGRLAWALRRSGQQDYFKLRSSQGYLFKETRAYVPKFMAILKILNNLQSLGFDQLNPDSGPPLERIQIRGSTDLQGLARHLGMDWSEFASLNPAFRRQISPPGRKSNVYLPARLGKQARNYLQKARSRPYEGFYRYTVRYGDSWWRISRNFNTPISVLKQINNKQSNILRPDQTVMIPQSASARQFRDDTPKTRLSNRANYTLRAGDTLWDLARRFGVGPKALVRANEVEDPQTLRPGQQIYIPGLKKEQEDKIEPRVPSASQTLVHYQIRHGDTLWDIARKFGVRPSQLQAWNSVSNARFIYPGEEIKIYTRKN